MSSSPYYPYPVGSMYASQPDDETSSMVDSVNDSESDCRCDSPWVQMSIIHEYWNSIANEDLFNLLLMVFVTLLVLWLMWMLLTSGSGGSTNSARKAMPSPTTS